MAENIALSVPPTVRTYLRAVRQKFPIKKAYLFGSYAKGTAREESDIDLAIISSAFVGNHFQDDVQLGLVKLDIDLRIEPVGFRPEDFTEENMLAEEILRTGIEISLEDV